MIDSQKTLRLVRNLRKGKHEKFAIQKALARFRSAESGSSYRVQPRADAIGGPESHGKIYRTQASLPNIGLRDEGDER
jgi:hypothetical protein